ncbi:prokaryotic homologs of the jab domain [Caudoviricetes sp.]|nr:prokaryotic homologs of the jab domain [Caudoviricetes sp.]
MILDEVSSEIRRLAGLMAPLETGGVLVGSVYPLGDSERVHVVEKVIPAPADSVSRNGEFERGIEGLEEALRRSLPLVYLGEWHTHGSGDLSPSQVDENAMIEIAGDDGYLQSLPILVIAHAQAAKREPFELTATLYGVDGATRLEAVE